MRNLFLLFQLIFFSIDKTNLKVKFKNWFNIIDKYDYVFTVKLSISNHKIKGYN